VGRRIPKDRPDVTNNLIIVEQNFTQAAGSAAADPVPELDVDEEE